jgi:hypothetical protein
MKRPSALCSATSRCAVSARTISCLTRGRPMVSRISSLGLSPLRARARPAHGAVGLPEPDQRQPCLGANYPVAGVLAAPGAGLGADRLSVASRRSRPTPLEREHGYRASALTGFIIFASESRGPIRTCVPHPPGPGQRQSPRFSRSPPPRTSVPSLPSRPQDCRRRCLRSPGSTAAAPMPTPRAAP